MTERTKSWIKENLMELILAAMFSAFWLSYESDKKDTAAFRDEILKNERRHDSEMQSISRIMRDDPDTDPYDKDLLLEYIKEQTRGGPAINK